MSDIWYAYQCIDVGQDDIEHYLLMIVGPIDSENNLRADGLHWEEAYLADGLYSEGPVLFNFVAAFDHSPSESERAALVPEEHRLKESFLEELGGDGSIGLTPEEIEAVSLAIQNRLIQLEQPNLTMTSAESFNLTRQAFLQHGVLTSLASRLGLTLKESWTIR